MKFVDRDEWIGWTQRQRAERLGLIVQNRRFLVLTPFAERARQLGL
jgi:hypothetical protein